MQKYSNSELLKDNLIPFHIHQGRIQTRFTILWELVKCKMEDETGGDKRRKSFVRWKEIQESLGFWIAHRGFWIQGTGFRILCHWNVDSRFQSVVGFRILELNSAFQLSKSRIPDCASKKSWIPNSSSKKIHELRNPEFFSWSEIVRKNHRLNSFRLKYRFKST